MTTKQQIGINLKNERKAKGLTQKYVADQMGILQTHYSRYERGIYQLDYDKIIAVCKIIETTPNALFEGLI